jgi:SAM-dependent methyltransferase
MSENVEETIPRNLQQSIQSVVDFAQVGTVVEVGFGNGTLANWMAKLLAGRGKVIAFEANSVLVRRAKSEFEGRVRNALFEFGDANDIPIPDNHADLSICKHLLCSLSKPGDAIREMIRVTKRGGRLIAIEPATLQAFYDPDDEEFASLSADVNRAFVEGWRKRGADQRVGLRVPSLFFESGLTGVTADGVVEVHLLSDSRRTKEDIKAQLDTEATNLDNDTMQLLVQGGLPDSTLRRFHTLATNRIAKYENSAEAANGSGYLRIMSVDVVVAGKKK